MSLTNATKRAPFNTIPHYTRNLTTLKEKAFENKVGNGDSKCW